MCGAGGGGLGEVSIVTAFYPREATRVKSQRTAFQRAATCHDQMNQPILISTLLVQGGKAYDPRIEVEEYILPIDALGQ